MPDIFTDLTKNTEDTATTEAAPYVDKYPVEDGGLPSPETVLTQDDSIQFLSEFLGLVAGEQFRELKISFILNKNQDARDKAGA